MFQFIGSGGRGIPLDEIIEETPTTKDTPTPKDIELRPANYTSNELAAYARSPEHENEYLSERSRDGSSS